jgi:hypothetical protein
MTSINFCFLLLFCLFMSDSFRTNDDNSGDDDVNDNDGDDDVNSDDGDDGNDDDDGDDDDADVYLNV